MISGLLLRLGRVVFGLAIGAFVVIGCGQWTQRTKTAGTSFHVKFGLKAENFFSDPQVIQLCRAIERNDLEEMQRLINAGADVNAVGRDNVTPLLWAYPDNHVDRFELLLSAGADPNVKLTGNLGVPSGFGIGQSVTLKAARSAFPSHFDLVMEHGGDPEITDKWGNPLLHQTITAGRDVERRVRLLVACGADVNALDCAGWPATISAISAFQQFAVADLLLDLGCDHTIPQRGTTRRLIHAVTNREENLHRYPEEVRRDHQRLLDRLVALGEDADAARRDNQRWSGPLALRSSGFVKDRVVRHNLFDLPQLPEEERTSQLKLAIDAGADLDRHNHAGETPAMLAVRQYGQFGYALQLLQAGADPGVHRRDPKTGRPLRATLIHYVAAARGKSHSFTEQQREEYEALVNWFTERGDSIEQAHRDRQMGIHLLELEPDQPNGGGS